MSGSGVLDELFRAGPEGAPATLDVATAMLAATVLCGVWTWVYRATHRSRTAPSFLVTLFLMAIGTSVVMMIIGSNVARAFSLVGALSIIRFRTAVKDARDTGFLFASIVCGMGCGAGFYGAAAALTAFGAPLVLLLHVLGVGRQTETVVRVTYKGGGDAAKALEQALARRFREVRLQTRALDFADGSETATYVVSRESAGSGDLHAALAGLSGLISLSLSPGDKAS